MNKRILALIALVLVFALGLTACGCAHDTWNNADCVNPKTCADCGETEGTPLGHSWLAADCDSPKTCENCSATEGAALGHTWTVATCTTPKTCQVCGTTEGAALGHAWVDATCTTPKTCEVCGTTEGEALPHTWTEATTEAPMTCTVCGATEGEKINTDPRFTTASTKDFHGEWVCVIEMPGSSMGLADFETPFQMELHMLLANDGNVTVTASLKNADEVTADLIVYMSDLLYDSLAALDMSKEDADAYVEANFGMTMEEYCTINVEAMDLAHIFDAFAINGVYYVADGRIYLDDAWYIVMSNYAYTLDGDTLTLHGDALGTGTNDTVFTRVTE